MIVVCPGCSRKYNIKDESIKSEKKVKCTLCGTIWIVKKSTEPEEKQEQQAQDPVSSFIEKHPTQSDLIQNIPHIKEPEKVKKPLFSCKFLIFTFFLSFILVSTFSLLFPEHVPFITNSQIKILHKTKDNIGKKVLEIIQITESIVLNRKLSIQNISYKLQDNSLIIHGELNNTTKRDMQIPDLLISITPKKALAKTEYMKYKLREKLIKANSVVKFTLKIEDVQDTSFDISIKLKNKN